MELEKLKSIIANTLSIEENKITVDSNFISDLNCDSLDLFQIIMAIEEELEIEIPTEQVENLKTVGDALKKINEITNK